MKIRQAKSINGKVEIPGDKSISHRAAIFASMAVGATRIANFSTSSDCTSTLNCLTELGVSISRNGKNVGVKGVGKRGFHRPNAPLDCGNSGTTMRLLAGVLAGQGFESVLTGDESLRSRPMKRIIKPLNLMGARIEAENYRAPLKISGMTQLTPINYQMPVASAQLKSAIILAGLNADGFTRVRSPVSQKKLSTSRNHTELMLKYLGADLSERNIREGEGFLHEIKVWGNSTLKAKDIEIPSDISSTSFFLVAAGCLGGSKISMKNVGINQTRSAIIEFLDKTGVNIEIANQKENCGEIAGDLRVLGDPQVFVRQRINRISGDIVANLIDEIPILSVLGTQLPEGLEIRDAKELRVKESDRIAAIVENLRRMKATVEEFSDGFRVKRSNLKGAVVDSFKDHRIAMAFAVAGLLAEGETEIVGADCVNISFPGFFQILKRIVR